MCIKEPFRASARPAGDVFTPWEPYASTPGRDDSELERFARLVAHDLRGPLEVVRQQLRGTRNGGGNAEEDALESLFREKALASTARVLEVAHRVLWYARLAHVARPMRPLHLAEPLQNAVEAIRNESDQAVEFDLESTALPWVKGDAALLCILFQELIINAVRYSESPRPRVMVSLAPGTGEGCEVLVTDNGTGLPAMDVHRVFELLFRAPAHAHLPGTGVGLTAARRIMAHHGGEIALSSQLGAGTIARLIFPVVVSQGSTPADGNRS